MKNEDHLKSRVIKEYTDELLVRKVETHGKIKRSLLKICLMRFVFKKKLKSSKQKKN